MTKTRDKPPAARTGAPPRRALPELWLVAATLTVIVAALVFVLMTVLPGGPMNRTYQVTTLCLTVAAVAGRLLLGYREGEQQDISARVERWALPLVFLAAFLPYLLTLRVGFLSDDFAIAATMAKASSLTGMTHDVPLPGLYRPVFAIGWWLQRSLWGDREFAYHLVSALLHAAAALLVYIVGRRVTRSASAALLGGLFFAFQPVHVEPVTWVCSEADAQCTLLALASLLALDAYLDSRRKWTLLAAALAFLAAMLAKEAALTLPLVALLWVWLRPRGAEQSAPQQAPRPAKPAVTLDSRRSREARALRSLGEAERAKQDRFSMLAFRVGAAYVLPLAVYAGLRLAALGRIGGYRVGPSFWTTIFPSAPMRQLMAFFLPVNQLLMRAVGGIWLELVLVAAMAVFTIWCLLNLTSVPGRRLLFYGGFFVLLVVPVWMYPPPIHMVATRWLYLPTVSLCWLVGEVLARRRPRGLAITGATLAGALALTLWYVTPWVGATHMARQVIAQGVRMVEHAPPGQRQPVFYVQDLPEVWLGAQALGNGYAEALSAVVGRPVLLLVVSPEHVPPEMMTVTRLRPREYLYRWDWQARTFRLVKEGRT